MRFIIENASRGCYVGFGHNTAGDWRPKFKWSILRSDRQVPRYPTRELAKKDLDRISKFVKKCYIFEFEHEMKYITSRQAKRERGK